MCKITFSLILRNNWSRLQKQKHFDFAKQRFTKKIHLHEKFLQILWSLPPKFKFEISLSFALVLNWKLHHQQFYFLCILVSLYRLYFWRKQKAIRLVYQISFWLSVWFATKYIGLLLEWRKWMDQLVEFKGIICPREIILIDALLIVGSDCLKH